MQQTALSRRTMNIEINCPLCERTVESYTKYVVGGSHATTIVYYWHDDGDLHWIVNKPIEDCLPLPPEGIVGS